MNINEQKPITAIDKIVVAMRRNQLDPSAQNEVVTVLYSLKGDVVRR
jgi:hypothetical protein